jgi:hypothetical protein
MIMQFDPRKITIQDGDSEMTLYTLVENFKQESEKIVNRELPDWVNGQEMYEQCFNPEDDMVNLYNPDILADSVLRVLEQYKFAPYKLLIPGATDDETQVIRDAIEQQMRWSGLIQGIREDPRGALCQILLGNSVVGYTLDEEGADDARPIKFVFYRLSQCYFSTNALSMRTVSGDHDVSRALLVSELPKDEIKSLFPDLDFKPGKLPFSTDESIVQKNSIAREDEEDQTEIGHFFDINKGIYCVMVGQTAAIPEGQLFSDIDASRDNYPYQLRGKNVIPAEILRFFRTPGRFHGKGLYHKFGKLARNSARRRSSAHRYIDRNIDPDRFIVMNPEDFGQFQAKVDEAQLARQMGLEPYIQIDPSQGVPQTTDFRSAPLTQEFERGEQDTQSLVMQAGVALRDVDRPATETATAVAAEEIAKTRLSALMARNNSTSVNFLRRAIVEAMKLIPEDCEIPVSTGIKVEITTPTGQVREVPVKNITYGDVSKFLNEEGREVYIEEDISAFESIGLELALLNTALGISQGTPMAQRIQQKILGLLGQETMIQDVTPPQNVQPKPLPPESLQGQGITG